MVDERQHTDPISLFDDWFGEAKASEPGLPEAVALATADRSGRPSVRMVLLKGHGPDGFVFYTNADSRKGSELEANPHAALLFHWKSLGRQIRIEGSVTPVSDTEADAYFATRSRDSQLGAVASDQSRPLESRALLTERFEEAKLRFRGRDVSRPERWLGYRVAPETIEFWTDGANRLHDRVLFVRTGTGWEQGLLFP
jgi:pyridoxamine 5'-phosphate oxidase